MNTGRSNFNQMSSVADEDERRRRCLEAGKEMLEKYKSERSKTKGTGHSQGEEMSDEESIHNDKSLGHRESCAHEGISSKDVTHSSVSMSEGEGDGDLEGLAGRVAELEELLQGKEAIVEALNAELDHLRAEASSPYSSQSQNSSTHGRDVISMYHTKLQEFEKAINKRDNFIEDLTCSLEQALAARDGVVAQLSSLNAMQVAPSTTNNMNLQEKIDTLESTLSDQKSVIQKLNAQLAEIHEHVQTLEMEKETRNAEINDYKLQINNLNEQIRIGATERNLNIAETLEQQKQYEARVDGIKQHMQLILERFTAETNTNTARRQQELKDLTAKHEAEIMNIQMKYEECAKALKEENKTLADRLNKELPDLETRHAKELSVFQTQLAHYKKTVESLKSELVNRSETQQTAQAEVNHYKSKLVQAENARRVQDLNHQKEKEMLGEQIKLHKIQLEEITTQYVAATAILESKESIERSLEQALENAGRLKDENQCLKFKLDDLSSRYSTAQSLIENGQVHERTLSSRIFDLEKSLSRLSGINVSTLSEFNETTYQTFDEVAIQYQITKQKLDEKADLEKLLVEKVHGLEDDVRKSKEELEHANLTKKSYEKQLKDMKNTCDKLKSEVAVFKETGLKDEGKSLDQDRIDMISELSRKAEEDQQEIKSLKSKLEEKETEITDYARKLAELTDKMKKAEEECDQLKNGLASAWAQCAEVEEKLNQTLALSDSKLDISLPKSAYSSALFSQYRIDKTINESANTTYNQSAETDKSYCEKETDTEKILHAKIASLMEENQNILKELESLKGLQSEYDAIKNKLNHYGMLSDKLSSEKQQVEEENIALKDKLENINSLKESVNQLRSEKESLRKEIETLVSVQDEQINAIKSESTMEIRKMQSLFLSVKEGNLDRSDLKAELEARHAKEMEELRTYFEQKCLDMEKQYSEEIFSQKSKKMSDNDSELEELTDHLYYGGAGDCLNVSNISEPISRAESPAVEVQSKCKSNNQENLSKTELEYEASIKALRQELERKIIKIQEMKFHYEKVLEDQRNLYEREVYDIRERRNYDLLRNRVNQHCQTEWDAGALENGELSQLREAYNRQLEEQIALARLDIVNALQEQIQALLAVESDGEDSWPPELLEIRDKFTNNAKKEMQQLKEAQHAEILRLKEDHSRHVARIIDRHQEEVNKFKVETNSQEIGSLEHDIMAERDALNKTCTMLKGLVEELIKYFVICEEELNNTVITEVLKRQLSSSFDNAEKTVQTMDNEVKEADETQETEESNASKNTSEIKIKRVHFAPQPTEIVSIINSDTDTLRNMFEEDDQIEEKLKQALNKCLDRLKFESAEILGTTSTAGGDRFSALSKEIMWMNKVNEELTLKVNHAEALIMSYQQESEQLKMTILNLQRKLANAESKKEIITEGYGEHDEGGGDVVTQDFSELQEKARHILSNGGGDYPYLLQIIEEFCRQSEKLVEDGKKEKEDLQQQIEAADKQLKGTRKFLDEQASEREAERDEAARQIHLLQEQLKEREREKERDQRITSEPSLSPDPSSDVSVLQATDINAAVEALESQMREMSSLMSESEAKKSETEAELQATIEKIWVLREIITGLEQQLQLKSEKEESLQVQIKQLETVIAVQTKNQHELAQELDAIKMGSESRRLNEHINHLQEELNKHKLSSEQFNVNSAALKQMKLELRDMQNQLDKRIKELESSHICGSNLSLSQPSEDVSVREQIDANRCPTPDDPNSPPMLPLEQLLKLKEKMLKHARVEEVAFKRIKDLEMQLTVIKNHNEELQAEQDILQQTASEQLFQIEAMRGRLEQHKQSAPFAQRQATSRLELQLHEANSKFQSLERTIGDKDLELKDMKSHLDRVNQLLLEKEAEIANIVEVEGVTIKKLKERLEVLEEENKILQAKVGVQEHAQIELPRLIDSMLADKNEEIDHLKEQLSKKEKQLEIYSSLTLDDAQLRNVMKQIEPKNSARTLSDILSIHSECEEMSEAIRCTQNATQTLPHNVSSLKVPTSSTLAKDTLDFSAVPFIDPNSMNIHIPPLDLGSHSQSLSSISHQNLNVSLGMDLIHSGMESKTFSPDDNVSAENKNVQESFQRKSSANDSNKSHVMSVKQTQTSINENIKEIRNLENQLHSVQQELEMKTAILDKREADLAILQKLYDELQLEFKEVAETLTQDKCFYQNQYELTCTSENKIKKDLQEVENTLKLRTEEIQEHKSKLQVNEKIIMELNTENTKLRKEMQKKEEDQMRKSSILLQENVKELESLKDAVLEKDITIETIQTRNFEIENENKQLYEFKTKYQQCKQELIECQNEIRRLTEGLNNRDQVIRRLEDMARRTSISGASSPSDEKDQEIHHLQEYLKEKDKVIRQMSDDSKSLHRALETIQNKMKESGNIVELRKKLKEERKLNAEFQEMIQKLSKELDDLKQPLNRRVQDDTDIEDMVQRELNLSAHLDRQIMNAIESDSEDNRTKEDMNAQNRNSSSSALQIKLIQANKTNEELKKMKDDLEIERGILKCQIAEYENRIFQLKSDWSVESKKVSKLDEELSSERNLVRTLKIQIEKSQRKMQSDHVQDTELIQFLQEKLKSSIENEAKLRNELSLLRQEQGRLEKLEFQKSENSSNFENLLEAERKKYFLLMKDFEQGERTNAELRDTLKRVQMEKNRYESQLEVTLEGNEKLISSLALVEGIKEHLETDLRRTKEEVKALEEECEWLRDRIKTMSEAEAKRQEQRATEHSQIKGLKREINNARDVMTDLEADMKQSKRELTDSLEREMKLSQNLEAAKERESELNQKLSITKEEDKKLKEMITDLQLNLKMTTVRELDLTKELKTRFSSENNGPAIFIQRIKDLTEVNERCVNEQIILREKLTKVQEEKDQLSQCVKLLESLLIRAKASSNSNDQNVESTEKMQHLYGNYLRADSRRKALTFQKRYLLGIVGGYQISEENTLCILAQLTQSERSHTLTDHNRKSPRVHFRSAVLVMISIHRMKWLIQRWRIGKRVGAKALLWNAEQSFPAIRKANLNHSPPVKDKPTSNGEGGSSDIAFGQYYERIRNIQDTLGLAMKDPGNRMIIPE